MTTEARELFPPRPEGVPADLTAPTAAYRRHTWLAFLGLLGFVGLYVGLTGYLGWIVYRLLYDAFTGGNAVLGVVLAILPTFFLVFLVRGLFVVKHLEDPTRVQVTEDEQPELFAFVNRIADENVPAVVTDGDLSTSLLGMSYLSRYEMTLTSELLVLRR